MFKSHEYIKYLPEPDEYLFKIVDDDFEELATSKATFLEGALNTFFNAYSTRNYSIDEMGINLALFCIHFENSNYYDWSVEDFTTYQDIYIPAYNKDITNYKAIAEARDRHLPILYLYS